MRKTVFAEGEYYHIYNRGTDKRDIFVDDRDFDRFLQSMNEFNAEEPIGSIFENSFHKHQLGSLASKSKKPLVRIIAYCLNPNHYHLILKQVAEKGIEKFMQRLGTGYTKYFNNRYQRTGSLFQGTFKAIHVETNEYLLHLSAYVNLNNQVHQLGSLASKSSLKEYMGESGSRFCVANEVLEQFPTKEGYWDFMQNSLQGILARRGKIEPRFLLE